MIIIGLIVVAISWFVFPGAGDVGYLSGFGAGAGALLFVIGLIWSRKSA